MIARPSAIPVSSELPDNQRHVVQALLVAPVLALAWWLANLPLTPFVWIAVIGYSMVQLALMLHGWVTATARWSWGGIVCDLVFALLLVLNAPLVGNQIYPLYLLIALRALAMYTYQPLGTLTPFLLGPAYMLALALSRQAAPLDGFETAAQWLLVCGSLGFGAAAIISATLTQRANDQLWNELQKAHVDTDKRVLQLEQTAGDLRARMRERHAIEEGLRAITSTLSLDEVLGQILDSTTQVLGPARVRAIALSLVRDGEFVHHAASDDAHAVTGWATLLARRAVAAGAPLVLVVDDADPELRAHMPDGVGSLLSVPLFSAGNATRGALSVLSYAPAAFTSGDARNLGGFAIQAGIAIGNAELHSRIDRQQRMLQAIVRDISDGLVVLDRVGDMVLTNGTAAALLVRESHDDAPSVLTQVRTLAERLRSSGLPGITADLRVQDEDGSEQVYQAIGSLVAAAGGAEQLVAIVLHDITAQRAEEHSRQQFISMVAHELRNPINSLNGFVKIVLQGRAGTLNPMQTEFLGIADGQIDVLKARIAELLEYNRTLAGRLTLKREPSDLALLLTAVAQQATLHAEQASLTLKCTFPDELPELLCDTGRLGQVLTNLIENAIKATPPGGVISIGAALRDEHVLLHVSDTGIGIPAEEQRRIFEPFVQGSSGHTNGGHLGLGLAICKQIVEGHGGQIWVESAADTGSTFQVALPLTLAPESALG